MSSAYQAVIWDFQWTGSRSAGFPCCNAMLLANMTIGQSSMKSLFLQTDEWENGGSEETEGGGGVVINVAGMRSDEIADR